MSNPRQLRLSYHFGKHLMRQTLMWFCVILDLYPHWRVTQARTTRGVEYFLQMGQFFIKFKWIQILWTFNDMQLFHRTSGWRCMPSAWPLIRHYTRNVSPPWLLVLMGYDIPFWQAFDVLNKHVKSGFFILVLAYICRLRNWGLLGGPKNKIGQFFIT